MLFRSENTQRDVNIGLINELAMLFGKLGLDTGAVLEAAGTKWNFLPFRPGLVGGHCIGVDPYYLTFKAQEIGYHPEVILAGRRINDSMGAYVAQEAVKLMITKGHKVKDSRVLVLGITFKENCPDIRNSRVIDVVREFQEFGCEVDVHDPWADAEEVKDEYGIDLITSKEDLLARKNSFVKHNGYDCIFLAVKHDQFLEYDIPELKNGNTAIFDAKGILEEADQQL